MKYRLAFLAFLLFVGCSPEIMTYTDHDRTYDLASFTTFDWSNDTDIKSSEDPRYNSAITDKRIKAAVEKELLQRGYTRSKSNPDRLIHYHIVVEDESILAPEPHGYLYGPYWMRARMHVYTYQEGTLIIDMMDAHSKELIWRSWATAAMELIAESDVETMIGRAVTKMFKNFPRAAGKEKSPGNTPSF